MRFALLLLWLTILAPAAHAADWLTWRRVGEFHVKNSFDPYEC